MRTIFLFILLFLIVQLLRAQTTFPSPGAQTICGTTATPLAAVSATDGVTIKPFLRLDASCLDQNLASFSLNSPAAFRRPTFCYNNGYFPASADYPLAIARNSTANSGSCAGGRSNVVADFSTVDKRPRGLTFTVNDVDNPYDSIEVRVYSQGALVSYNFVFGEPNPANSFAWSKNTSGTGTVVQFNGGANGIWGESSASTDNAKGAIHFSVDPALYVDSVVLTHIIRNGRNDINAAVSIGDFKWMSVQALPVVFGPVEAQLAGGILVVNWQTLSEKNVDHFNIEISENGTDFSTIGTVTSKSEAGNSDHILNYNFSAGSKLSGASFLLIMLLTGAWALARKKKIAFVAVLVVAMGLSCSKSGGDIDADLSRIYVRIAQVDGDGSKTFSKVVKAVKQ
ncbi:hypothetical protein ABDK00_000840 [Niabella insulamsoli]|uniref:hypothetical protein n=1 Tax=Niabella insulamsoli TaxID=3144874 RepID=UPI0031FD6D77